MTAPTPVPAAPEAPPSALWGLRCATAGHRGYGTVHHQTEGQHRLSGLIAGTSCYALVVSRDGGHTWEVPDA